MNHPAEFWVCNKINHHRGGDLAAPHEERKVKMTHNEFMEISGQKVSFGVYTKTFEPMYIATNMGKREFINFMMPTIKAVAKAERSVRETAAAQKIGFVYLIRGEFTNGDYNVDEAECVSVNEISGKMAVRWTGNFGIRMEADSGKIFKEYNEVKLLPKRAG